MKGKTLRPVILAGAGILREFGMVECNLGWFKCFLLVTSSCGVLLCDHHCRCYSAWSRRAAPLIIQFAPVCRKSDCLVVVQHTTKVDFSKYSVCACHTGAGILQEFGRVECDLGWFKVLRTVNCSFLYVNKFFFWSYSFYPGYTTSLVSTIS